MRIKIWCVTHNCEVGELGPDTPVFEYDNNLRNFKIRIDNTYCYFADYDYPERSDEHEYMIGTVIS